ncbi:PREDICTED: uncharacterized protein LOC109586601 [Amphimedon queenslandica]|uniref:Uncharacterized protein n=1 Tax=Amphimedon queenslandica TaxID=400682 RepID=A0AAN0JMY3_AMPQE|nr:PREDICTED: uncharacterized protein LOC109586601 [Amphimedon queenslandica]|eukprot:XP_019858359.1 PREDICTED: uncharacterized protein LOC109586601 [Amphimedon queenslandica]
MLRPVLLCIVLLHCFNISSANDEESSSCQAAATLSCEDIKNYWPESSSGYYNIIGKGNVFCNMEMLQESIVNPSNIQPTETVLTSSESTETNSVLLTSSVLLSTSSVYPTEFSSISLSIPSSSVIPLETNVLPEPCGSGGGWTRLAYLDMSDATQNCPFGFKLYQSGGVRACGRTNSSGGCEAMKHSHLL